MYKAFLIKYAEIGVKGNNKRVFEDALVNEVKRALKKITGEFKVIRHEGRIYAQCLSEYDYDEVVTALKRSIARPAVPSGRPPWPGILCE